MRRKLLIILAVIVLLLLGGLVISHFIFNTDDVDETCTVSGIAVRLSDGRIMLLSESDGEILLYGNVDFSEVSDGDSICIVCMGVEETYPAGACVTEMVINRKGTGDDIPKDKFEMLESMGYELAVEETENNEDENDKSAIADDEPTPITKEEVKTFSITCEIEKEADFDDFSDIMAGDYLGTWYTPEWKEAIRLYEDGCYVYMPEVGEYGDKFYEWELVDRSQKGLCPMLEIFYAGKDTPGYAYYIGGKRDNYFWCNAQGLIFYKQ